jgi:putative SOS response-associated peptidase YedK
MTRSLPPSTALVCAACNPSPMLVCESLSSSANGAFEIGTADDSPMVMAGLWDTWKSPKSGEEIVTCTVITCEPNGAMAELHDRMPVIG